VLTLTKEQKRVLSELNKALQAGISEEQLYTKSGVRLIIKQVVSEDWDLLRFHENEVSAGTLCRAGYRAIGRKVVNRLLRPLDELKRVSTLLVPGR